MEDQTNNDREGKFNILADGLPENALKELVEGMVEGSHNDPFMIYAGVVATYMGIHGDIVLENGEPIPTYIEALYASRCVKDCSRALMIWVDTFAEGNADTVKASEIAAYIKQGNMDLADVVRSLSGLN